MSESENPLCDRSQATKISVAIIGCGKLGTALLIGFLSCHQIAAKHKRHSSTISDSMQEFTTAPVRITHITVTVRQPDSATRLMNEIKSANDTKLQSAPQEDAAAVTVSVRLCQENAQIIQESDIIIIGCKPSTLSSMFGDPEMRAAFLRGDQNRDHQKRTLVSLVGGVSIALLKQYLRCGEIKVNDPEITLGKSHYPVIVRAIPNLAARQRESMTIISAPLFATEEEDIDRVSSLFGLLGPTMQIPERHFNIASALASSSVAFYASVIASSATGATDEGRDAGGPLCREAALWIAAQAARGASCLIMSGEDPEHIVRQVATKGGSTEVGLRFMTEAGIGRIMSSTVSECGRATGNLSSWANN
ncbi:hypothetical protein BJ878DRAFT_521219 [Calycina marina]|uniref:Pyrroline-5-carboxylate reductase n=1 Tax=Calycina marina TaxID=1763456 RepID=A0A9P7YWK8_9HELO|nr:hypothetical protein BJ878DRAFT_521219 [Calycina marina]